MAYMSEQMDEAEMRLERALDIARRLALEHGIEQPEHKLALARMIMADFAGQKHCEKLQAIAEALSGLPSDLADIGLDERLCDDYPLPSPSLDGSNAHWGLSQKRSERRSNERESEPSLASLSWCSGGSP